VIRGWRVLDDQALSTTEVLVGALPGQVCGDTLDLRRRTGMRRVGAWELVPLDGVMDRPEEWGLLLL